MAQKEKFPLSFIISAVFVCSFTIIVSSFGYIAFGIEVDDIVLLNMPNGNLTFAVRIIYCICLLGSYPIQMFAAIEIFEKYE
jgi:proton-coupled amino acid transporter